MIHFTRGDIFAQPAEAIVNPVNCVGVAGAGLALQFKRRHPDAFLAYRRACAQGRVRPGRMFMFDTGCDRPRWIAHFPTKRHWRDASMIGDIEAGLRDLAATVTRHGIRSIAIPPLGCGLGGLDWRAVRPLVTVCFADMPGRVIVLEPAPVPPGPRAASPPPSAPSRDDRPSPSVPCLRQGPSFPAGIGADGRGEEERSLERGEREGDRERTGPFGNHRHQPG